MSDATATSPTKGPDRSGEFIAVSVVLTVFASVFVVARLWTRIFRTQAFGMDDGFIIVAWAATIATSALGVASAVNGYGKPILTIPPAQLLQALKYSNFAILTNGVAMGTMKLSIGYSMLRIQLARTFTMVVWFTMVLSVLVNLNVLVGCFKSCTPMEKIWNPVIPGTCWPLQVNMAMAYLQSAGNILTDILLTFGLLACLTRLKLSTYNRWALRGVFLIGLVATISAIVKITKVSVLMKTMDPTLEGIGLSIWVSVEMTCGLWAASLPPLKATFEGILTRYFGVTIGTSSSRYASTRNRYGHGKGGGGGGYGYGYGYGRSRASRLPDQLSGDHNDNIYDGCEEGKTMGTTTFVLDTITVSRNNNNNNNNNNKSAGSSSHDNNDDDNNDIISDDSDQRHILKSGGPQPPGQGGQGPAFLHGITKTVDYTVSDEARRSTPQLHPRRGPPGLPPSPPSPPGGRRAGGRRSNDSK